MTESELKARFRADFGRLCADISTPPWLEMEEAVVAAFHRIKERPDDLAWIYQVASSVAGADFAAEAQKKGDAERRARLVEAGAILWRLVLALQEKRG